MFVKQFGWLARRGACLAGPIGSVIEVDVSSLGSCEPTRPFSASSSSRSDLRSDCLGVIWSSLTGN